MFTVLWHDTRLMSLIASSVGVLALVLFAVAMMNWFIHRPLFDLNRIELAGETQRVNLVSFEANVVPKLGGSFFSVNLRQVRELVEAQPWVRKAVVQRQWPNGLLVSIEAHRPLALWGETQLVNTFGEVFTANLAEVNERGELAQLSGPPGSEELVARMYVDASRSLQKVGLSPLEMKLSPRYGWTFLTAQGVKIELGREEQHMGIEDKLARLKRVYTSMKSSLMQSIQVIDMRYPMGLAIRGEDLLADVSVVK